MMTNSDPLGVLESTRVVVDSAQYVQIDRGAIELVAGIIQHQTLPPPAWQNALHLHDGTWRTAAWVFVLDALNFCFWSRSSDSACRWRVTYADQTFNGYWALATALRRAVDEGAPLREPAYLANISDSEVAHLLRPDPGAQPIPLFAARVSNLRELGRGLLDYAGSRPAIEAFIEDAKQSAPALVRSVAQWFPSFNDVAMLDGHPVHFFKRAQILVADLHGAFAGEGFGHFDDLETLTAFADYKVPQVLRHFGVLSYDRDLAGQLDRFELIPAGSRREIEIRAATVWACELIRQTLQRRGHSMLAFEIDWALWQAGQTLPLPTHPYHRTLTIYY